MLKAKSPFANQSYSVKDASANDDLQSNKNENTESSNSNRISNREYNEDDFGAEEEDPEWVDIDVKDIENNQINFQPVPQNNILNRIQENLSKENDLDKSDEKDSKEDEDALNRLGKISCINNKNLLEIVPIEKKNILARQEIKNQAIILNIDDEKKVLDANDLFDLANTNAKNEEEKEANSINDAAENADAMKREALNFDATELKNTLAGLNFFDIFINENNGNKEVNSLEGLDEALMKNLFVSQNSLNSAIFNTNGQSEMIESSPEKQNILLKTLNFTSELQKNIFQGRKESGDTEGENKQNIDSDEHRENSINKLINSNNNQKDSTSTTPNNKPEINKDLFEKFNEQLKMRGINPENFNFNMANANFNNMLFNANNLTKTLNNNSNNTNNHINNNQTKNIINNHLINNRINMPPNAIPNMIPGPSMIPYPLLNRELIINNMIQQGLIKPNMNLNAQRQDLTTHQMQYLENLKNAEQNKNQRNNYNSHSGSESYKDKSLMHQNFLENPITVVEKNLVKKGWAIMDDKNKPNKFLNSVELQALLEAEKKKNNITKMNFICDYESDMFFKPADLLEELQETMPKLLENLNAKNQQQKMQTAPHMIPDIRMMGFPIVNPAAMQNMNKENPAFKIPGMPINLNPMMIDQRIVNMNMIPPFTQFANIRGNTIGGANNINNNFNGQAVNMNINLQFVNNDIKLNNIMVGNIANVNNKNNNNTEENIDLQNNKNINNNNTIQPNKNDSGSNSNSGYNVNMIPPGFNKNLLQNFQKGQSIPPGFPINPNFNMAAVNNMYFSAMNQMIQNNNPNNKVNANNASSNYINNSSGQNAKNDNNNLQDNFSNAQNDPINKSELNSFFGSNVFYESIKQNNNNNNKFNDKMKSDKNVKANMTNNTKSNKATEVNKPSNLSQIVNFKGNTNNNKNQNYKK